MQSKLEATQAEMTRDLVVADVRQFFVQYDGVPETAEIGTPVRLLHEVNQAFDLGSFDYDELRDLRESVEAQEAEIEKKNEQIIKLQAVETKYNDLVERLRGIVESTGQYTTTGELETAVAALLGQRKPRRRGKKAAK